MKLMSRDELRIIIEDAFQAGFFAGIDEANGQIHVQDVSTYSEEILSELGEPKPKDSE